MKRFISLLLSLLILALCACSVPAEPEPTSVSTPEATARPTPEPTPDPNLPYAERYGLPFPEEYELRDGTAANGTNGKIGYVLHTPYFPRLINKETGEYIPNSDTESIVSTGDMYYIIPEIKLEPAEESGKSILSFDLQVNNYSSAEYTLNKSLQDKGNSTGLKASTPQFFDYYTGMTVPAKWTKNNEAYDSSMMVEINGKSFEIKYQQSVSLDLSYLGGHYGSDGLWHNTLYAKGTIQYRFLIPEDYDGLCFAMRKNQYGDGYEYEEVNYDTIFESKPWMEKFEDENSKISTDDYFYVRISDLKAKLDSEKDNIYK